tara:strand:- start:464 stop:1018 length:555 start_codon:yes stop_codon:yes gene_type:complete
MAATHELIEVVTASGGSTAYLEFTSIPQTFTNLEVVWSLKLDSYNPTSATLHQMYWRVNGSSTSSVYPNMYRGMFYGTGTAVWKYDTAGNYETQVGLASANTPNMNCGLLNIYDYTSTGGTGKSIQGMNSCMQYDANSYDRTLLITSGNLNIAEAVTSLKLSAYNDEVIADDSNIRLYGINRSA